MNNFFCLICLISFVGAAVIQSEVNGVKVFTKTDNIFVGHFDPCHTSDEIKVKHNSLFKIQILGGTDETKDHAWQLKRDNYRNIQLVDQNDSGHTSFFEQNLPGKNISSYQSFMFLADSLGESKLNFEYRRKCCADIKYNWCLSVKVTMF